MNIELNIDDLIEELNLPSNIADIIVEKAVDDVTVEIFRNWSLQASNGLNSTRQDYINGLETINNGQFSRIIRLNGQFNNMLEQGAPAFDMKEGFRKSNKVKFSVKTNKDGSTTTSWYLTIPFRHGVPTTIGENPAFSNVMPEEIYELVRYREANKGLKKSEIPSPFNSLRTRAQIPQANGRPIPAYKHKSSIYQGLMKKTAAYGSVTQNYYMTFRRVSENSDPFSWYHRGIEANNFLQKAIASSDISTVAENSVDKTLSDLGYGK